MALPFSRNTDYTPGQPVKSADLNDIQDQIITIAPAQSDNLHGYAWFEIDTLNSARASVGTPTLGANETWTLDPLETIVCRLGVTAGQYVQKIEVRGTDVVTNRIEATLISAQDGSTVDIAQAFSTLSGLAQDIEIDITGAEVSPTDGTMGYFLRIRNADAGGGSVVVRKARMRMARISNPA